MSLSFEDYLRVEAAGQRTVALKLVHVDMAGDLLAGVLLSQLVYWHSPNRETGETRLTFEREGHRWVRKAYDEWHEECRLTVAQARRAVEHLRGRGLVETRVWKHHGTPTLHLRIVAEAFMAAFDTASSLVSPEMRHSANGLVAQNGSAAPDLRQDADGNAPQRKSEMRHSASPSMEEITSETTVQREDPPTPQTPPLALVAQARPADQPLALFEHWQSTSGRERAAFSPKRRRLAVQAVKTYGLEYCLKAAEGWQHSTFHRGENDRGTVYNDFELIFRDAQQVERFYAFAEGSNVARPTRNGMIDWAAVTAQLEAADAAREQQPAIGGRG